MGKIEEHVSLVETPKRPDYGTYEIAEMVGVYPTTVIHWIEEQKLKSYRTPGGHRRITHEALRDFLAAYQFPAPRDFSSKKKPRVLVVDDDADVLALMERAIKKHFGSQVDLQTFANGYEALVQAGKSMPEVAIIDVVMPQMDGFQVCQAIRHEWGDKVQLMMMTGRDTPEHRERAKSVKAKYFVKPLEIAALMEAVEAALQGDAVQGGGKKS